MDVKQYDELAVALALIQDREAYLKEKLQERAGDLLEEQDRLRKLRQGLTGSSSEQGAIQFFGPILHQQTGEKTFAGGMLSIVTGSEVIYDEAALVAHLAQQGRYGYLSIRRKQTEAMLRSTLDYEPDLPARIEFGPKINGVDALKISKGFEVPPDARWDEEKIRALVESAVAERQKVERETAAAHSDEILTRLAEKSESLDVPPAPQPDDMIDVPAALRAANEARAARQADQDKLPF